MVKDLSLPSKIRNQKNRLRFYDEGIEKRVDFECVGMCIAVRHRLAVVQVQSSGEVCGWMVLCRCREPLNGC